jgi:ketosteroid isomerase-like protein
MPWFPEFTSAVELARLHTRATGQADPVGQYLVALSTGDVSAVETVWPGEVVVLDPRAGEVRGHRYLKRFIRENRSWMAERHVRTEVVASSRAEGRGVLELLAHLTYEGQELAWPVAVVAESRDEQSVVFRTYCSQWPVDGRRHVRPPILEPDTLSPGDVVGRFQAALADGDVDDIVATFAPEGYVRESLALEVDHRGTAALRAYFTRCFGAGGGIGVQQCAMTDDGVRCALEYTCVRWGRHAVPPQAGLAVYERGPDGLLSAVRIYDDVEAPSDLV